MIASFKIGFSTIFYNIYVVSILHQKMVIFVINTISGGHKVVVNNKLCNDLLINVLFHRKKVLKYKVKKERRSKRKYINVVNFTTHKGWFSRFPRVEMFQD